MRTTRFLSCLCAFLLTVALIPSAAFAQKSASDGVRVPVEELLAKGDYVEGEAIAIVRAGADVDVSAQTESLTEVEADSVELAAAGAANSESAVDAEVAQRVNSVSADRYEIRHVVDHARTTEQILRELYDDPDVVSAEPNYLIQNPNSLDAQDDAFESASESSSQEGASEFDEPVSNDLDDVTRDGDAPLSAQPSADATEGSALATQDDASAGDVSALSADGVASEDSVLPLAADAASPLFAQSAGDNPKDLTCEQWSLDESVAAYGYNTTTRSPQGTYSMNVPGWASGRHDSSSVNATTGTVCIMDTGIDTTHPDLVPVLFDFSDSGNFPASRYAELHAKYGLQKYGMNASGDSNPAVDGYDSHGTHVAGIVAAQWNDDGVSGIASGTKIFAVRIFGPADTQDEVSVLKGFEFLVDVAQDVNLKAVNCSWGGGITQFGYEVMVNELGKNGVNVVFASGNRTADLDETMDNGAMNSPYSISVNAAQPDGKPTEFSCYGQSSTDVFAPGTQITSTIFQTIDFMTDGKLTGRNVFMRFFPEATDASNLMAYEKFSGGSTGGVRLFKENPATNADPQEITSFVDSGVGYGDTYAAAVNVSSLHKPSKEEPVIFNGSSGYVYAAIPLDSSVSDTSAALANVKYVSMDLAMSDSFKPIGGIASITCSIEGETKPDEVDTTASKAFYQDDGGVWHEGVNSGWVASATYTTYQCQWSLNSFNVDEFVSASNHAHQWLLDNPGKTLPGEVTEAGGYENYHDPGKATGVYGWQPGDGKTYVIVKVGVAAHGSEPSSSTKLCMDDMALGTGDAYVAGYENMPGTSMAAPAVTGCLAVIAKGEKNNSEMTADELEQASLARASKLLASVDYDDDLSKLCRTGGRVDLKHQSEFTKKAPLITKAIADGDELTVSGYFFGTSGSLAVDDVLVSAGDIVSWSSDSIVASLSALGLDNGSHVVKVTNSDGAIMRATFSYSNIEAKGNPLYERTHVVPVDDPQFAADRTDRLYGAMASCDGDLYALSAQGKNHCAQALWRFDTQEEGWSRCADLPDVCKGSAVSETSLFSYRGDIYFTTVSTNYKLGQVTIWKYDIAADSWAEINRPTGGSWPNGAICVLGDDLIMVGMSDFQFASSSSSDETGAGTGYSLRAASDDAEGAVEEEPSSTKFYCGVLDLDSGTLTKIDGAFDGDVANMSFDGVKAASSESKIYLYAPKGSDDEEDTVDSDWLVRLTYDKAANTMSYENLRSQAAKVVGSDLVPEFDKDIGDQSNGAYVTLAGLPDGVAIIGSSTLGEDTHIIKDDGSEAFAYDRTSSYHHVFEPLATWSDDGYLYVTGTNATEPDVMYFRSTYYGQSIPDNPVDPGDDGGDGATGASSSSSTLPKTGDMLLWAGLVIAALAALASAAYGLRKGRGRS